MLLSRGATELRSRVAPRLGLNSLMGKSLEDSRSRCVSSFFLQTQAPVTRWLLLLQEIGHNPDRAAEDSAPDD